MHIGHSFAMNLMRKFRRIFSGALIRGWHLEMSVFKEEIERLSGRRVANLKRGPKGKASAE
ncbi:MAG: hypothetical protein C0630_05150 [Sedimenticola selenatireducens]|uniref:Uncharacterized protein n=1 Tax=Sedimenticola selenatireducens TaxID=191960 RepID=A0A2N6CZ06_9GAMM|nr:MAG: hypothetical protein C0630_05150 [Sedimenticola selenatireducens]